MGLRLRKLDEGIDERSEEIAHLCIVTAHALFLRSHRADQSRARGIAVVDDGLTFEDTGERG